VAKNLQTVLYALIFTLAIAAPTHADSDKKPHHDGKAQTQKAHHFSKHWAKTLSAEQKLSVDKMHLELGRHMAVLKAEEALKQKQLNVLTARDNADKTAIYAKIEELTAIGADILRQRYDHLLEMRAVLTAEQRISYDMGILKRSGAK